LIGYEKGSLASLETKNLSRST